MDQTTRAGREPGEPLRERDVSDETDASDLLIDTDDGRVADGAGFEDWSDELADDSRDEWDEADRRAIDDPEHSGHDVQKWVSWGIVAACCVFVFATLNPHLIFQNSTATGGDMGAHCLGPAVPRADHLLPEFRLCGWTQDWYAGFPAYVFCMVVPSLIVLWVSAGVHLVGRHRRSLLGLLVFGLLLAGLVVGTRALLRRLGPGHWGARSCGSASCSSRSCSCRCRTTSPSSSSISGRSRSPSRRTCSPARPRSRPGPPLVALATLPVHLRQGLHHPRRQRRLDARRRVRVLDLADVVPALPGGHLPWGAHRA